MRRFIAFAGLFLCAQAARAVVAEKHAALSPVTGGDVLQWFLGLAAVLLVIVGCAWMARKFGSFSPRGNGSLKVLEGLSLGTRERVVLLQADKKRLLVGITPGQMRTLLVLEDADPNESDPRSRDDAQPSRTFGDNLRDVLQGGAK